MNPITEASAITIDMSKIPRCRVDDLLAAMTAPLTAFYSNPENVAKYEAWLKARNERKGRLTNETGTHLAGTRR